MAKDKSYREMFGLELPPEGTKVKIKWMAGVNYYILWPDCPDKENILYSHINKKDAESIVTKH